MPYIFSSILAVSIQKSDGEESIPIERALLKSLALVALTFVFGGLYGLFKTHQPTSFNEKHSKNTASFSPKSLIATGVSLLLPFYAAFSLGASRVAIVLLLHLSSFTPILPSSTVAEVLYQLKRQRTLTAVVATMFLADAVGVTSHVSMSSCVRGYLALLVSCFIVPPPFAIPDSNDAAQFKIGLSSSSTSASAGADKIRMRAPKLTNLDSDESGVVLVAGVTIGALTLIAAAVSGNVSIGSRDIFFGVVTAAATLLANDNVSPITFRGDPSHIGLLSGLILTFISTTLLAENPRKEFSVQLILTGLSYAVQSYDITNERNRKSSCHDVHHHHEHDHDNSLSSFTKYLLVKSENWPLLHSIIKEKDSRKIFYFMMLNFAFMKVQMVYGVITGSLGLLSDSIHMLFDCLALAVGLCAAVMSKWPPSERFPYGYGKVDTLAGFANGVFLM